VGSLNVAPASLRHSRCYLSSFGNCGSQITKEHFISRNILERIVENNVRQGQGSSTLKFEGMGHFFGGRENIEIGIDAFASKVLCDQHNAALSDLDTAVGLAFSTIESLERNLLSLATTDHELKAFFMSSGLDIERWMIKVYCGLVAAGKIRSSSGQVIDIGSLHGPLLDSLMWATPLPHPLGLYMHTFVGQKRRANGLSFGTIKLTDGSDEVGGLILSLSLMHFVLVTSPAYGTRFNEPNWYWHQDISFNIKRGTSRVVYLFTY
jgi:hypothetical protein